MRIIKYKPADSPEFRNFVEIGSCERNYYFINFYLPGAHEKKSGKLYFKNYESWFENFKQEPIGAKMVILNYYLSEYLGWSTSENYPHQDYFTEVYGAKTFDVISKNLNYLLQFNNKWFLLKSSIFKGLDLDFDDIEERILDSKENKNGIKTSIEFEDRSCIKFIDEDDSISSFYVPEEEYLGLKNEIENIVTVFQP